jgi:hypothetical protein
MVAGTRLTPFMPKFPQGGRGPLFGTGCFAAADPRGPKIFFDRLSISGRPKRHTIEANCW